jgi:hypothetical protein
MGSLTSLEIFSEEDWANMLLASERKLMLYFYEALGKHSEFEIPVSGLGRPREAGCCEKTHDKAH